MRKTVVPVADKEFFVNKYGKNKEFDILREFQAEACYIFRDIPTGEDEYFYKWAEYAQHFGVPTRLLDWTSNPLVALFFACNSGKSDAAIRILNEKNTLIFGTIV